MWCALRTCAPPLAPADPFLSRKGTLWTTHVKRGAFGGRLARIEVAVGFPRVLTIEKQFSWEGVERGLCGWCLGDVRDTQFVVEYRLRYRAPWSKR